MAKRHTKPDPAARARSRPAAPRPDEVGGGPWQALVDAAVELAGEGDPDKVTVREAGRRAGLPASVPPRIFPSRAALMGAVAAEALRDFEADMQRALAAVGGDDPVQQLRAAARAFILWTLRNPAHFRILSARDLISFAQVPELVDDVRDIAESTTALTSVAQGRGQLPACDTRLLVLASRALVYGLARMKLDGQLPQWGVDESDAEPALLAAFDLYVELLVQAAHAAPQPGS
jgi:AcrR family transcriptional regulator